MDVTPAQQVKREFKCEKKFRCPENCGALIDRARALALHYTYVHKENKNILLHNLGSLLSSVY